MKLIKNIRYACLAFLPWAMLSCDPIEKRDEMPGLISRDQIKFSVTQKSGHDNVVYLENQTKGIIPFWNFGSGISYKQKDTLNIPFAGDYWIKFIAYSGGGAVADSVKITISENDEEFFKDPMWALLTNGAEGKTWVWATDNPTGYVRGIGGYNADNFNPLDGFGWWGTGTDFEKGEFTLDLDGAANFTKSPDGGTPEHGFFELDTVANNIKFIGATMYNQEADNTTSTYKIGKLTEDELIFCQIYSWGGQRPYYFKRKGYNFPN